MLQDSALEAQGIRVEIDPHTGKFSFSKDGVPARHEEGDDDEDQRRDYTAEGAHANNRMSAADGKTKDYDSIQVAEEL